MPRAPWRRSLFEWIADRPIAIQLWLLDRIAGPFPETEADRIREAEMGRLRRAFPDVDVDGTGPVNKRRSRRRSMHRFVIALLTAGMLGAVAQPVAAADNPQQERMKDCNQQAAGMTGDTRQNFMSGCLAGEATHPKCTPGKK